MPTTSYTSTFRLKSSNNSKVLSVRITHVVDVLSKSDPPVTIPRELPAVLPITFTSNIVIVLHGSFNRTKQSSMQMVESRLVKMFYQALQQNRESLVLDEVSELFMDSGLLQVAITPSGPFASDCFLSIFPPISLNKIIVEALWIQKDSTDVLAPSGNPFNPETLSPDTSEIWTMALDKIILQLLKRYPFIFGTWKQSFAANTRFHPSIAESMCNMFIRSPNPSFTSKGMVLFTELRAKLEAYKKGLWDTLTAVQRRDMKPLLTFSDLEPANLSGGVSSALPDVDEDRFREVIRQALQLVFIQKITPLKKDMIIQPSSVDFISTLVSLPPTVLQDEEMKYADECVLSTQSSESGDKELDNSSSARKNTCFGRAGSPQSIAADEPDI